MKFRRQVCRVNGEDSETRNIGIGVQQDSCLGPLLFLLYRNDLPFSLKDCQATMYANVTSISFSTKNIDDVITTISNDLVSLEEWLCGNKLSVNLVKTQAMMTGFKHKLSGCNHHKDTGISVKINADDIKLVSSIKCLGVQINENLSWDEQIKAFKVKVSRAIDLLKYAKRFLSNDTLCKMYTALVEPYFSFCSSVWGCCLETIIKSLQRLQNRATRIVGTRAYDYSATSMLKELGWSSIKDIIFKETNIMTFKALKHDLELSCLNGLF